MTTRTFNLPRDHRQHTDVYFLHASEVLKKEDINPYVTMQVFMRDGPGRAHGLDEAVEMLEAYSNLKGNHGHVDALPEGSPYQPGDTFMHIHAYLQDIIELETMYLGAISRETSWANGGGAIDFGAMLDDAKAIRDLCPDKTLVYFGARHWHYSEDDAVARALIQEAGWDSASTDFGARAAGQSKGVGTVPHALVLAFGFEMGPSRATAEATAAFDRHIEPESPRIALIDTFGKEIDDALATARVLGENLFAVRLDTAGEIIAQGGRPSREAEAHYTAGRGVRTVSARALRDALDAEGFEDVGIVLSSGFGNVDKVRAFVEEENRNGRLFEALGIGGIFPGRHATADVVRAADTHKARLRHFAKTGRHYKPNPAMRRVF
ncbi:nicotinate phosphoribosyltransferase [Desulfohalovibrio reitneri]|uniref:nicotinate phosphoribosyltransferase n=1 Tax=Desulfohalovibrio reitneri TaxID=1307759 RepID=UPI0004A6F81F|nr:nicotinate phosphoribosyltransferase [Desulfohalovibrio reitneri]